MSGDEPVTGSPEAQHRAQAAYDANTKGLGPKDDRNAAIEPEAQGDPTRLKFSIEGGHSPEVIAFKCDLDVAIASMQNVLHHSTGDKARWCILAITELEVACMWGVKALTA
jgi:hypothetical protein